MKAVWKFALKLELASQVLVLPRGAIFLSLQLQTEIPATHTPVAWFEVDSTQPCETRIFRFIFTGDEVPDNCKNYLGTIQVLSGYVVHLYEEEKIVDLTTCQFQAFNLEPMGKA
jgi:hypothetical protein